MSRYDPHARDWDADQTAQRHARSRNGNGAGGDEPPPNLLRFVHVSELRVEAPQWLVRHLIESGAFVMVYGDSETGKSLFCTALGLCIAGEVPFYGYTVKHGPVLYIIGEGQRGFGRRVRAWSRHHGIDVQDLPFYVAVMPTSLTDEASQIWLRKQVEEFANEHGQPVLIVIDTLARNFGGGDENSTRDMGIAVRACDMLRAQTGAALLLPHHSGHSDKARARGSYALHAALDFEYSFTRGDDGCIYVEAKKTKDSTPLKPMAFRLERVELGIYDDEGEPVSSVVLVSAPYQEPAKSAQGADANGKWQLVALKVLRDLYEQHRANVAKSGRDPDCARVEQRDWMLACTDTANGGMPRNRFYDAKRTLQNKKLIALNGPHVVLLPTDSGLSGFDRSGHETDGNGQGTTP